MLTIWIIHRDAHQRAALARIAGVGDSAVLAAPHDRLLEAASAPNVVLLGLTEDFEHELQFVHRHAPRHPGSEWILLPNADDRAEAERLFDTLTPRYVSYPPDATALRRALRDALGRRHVDTLSSRRIREALRTRFSRWFAGLELPELLRALDPRRAHVPVMIRA
jgi:DNA-binding NarL/FixJ family response regulator